MKAKLIKTEVNYILEDDKGVVIASTSLKKEGLSLSLKNCQAIELGYDLDELARKEILYNDQKREWWKQGAKYILEILGDKKFSEEDIDKAFNTGVEMLDSPRKYNDVLEELKKSLQQTEWDVEIVMEKVIDETKIVGAVKGVKGSGDKITTYKQVPRLDADGCLILKTFKTE